MRISREAIDHVLRVVHLSVEKVIEHLRENGVTDRTGGCFAFGIRCENHYQSHAPLTSNRVDVFEAPALIKAPIGVVWVQKIVKYSGFSQEKNERLVRNPDHLSSAQSRDPAHEKWGGAIRAKLGARAIERLFDPADSLGRADVNAYLSFSGLPELGDETAMILAATGLGFDISIPEIVKASDNTVARRLLGSDAYPKDFVYP